MKICIIGADRVVAGSVLHKYMEALLAAGHEIVELKELRNLCCKITCDLTDNRGVARRGQRLGTKPWDRR